MKNIGKVIVVLVIIAAGIYAFKETLVENKELAIYCINEAETDLVKENRKVNIKNNEDLVNKVIIELKKVPLNKKYKRLIPENVDVDRLTLNENEKAVEIDLTKYFEDLSNKEKLFLISGVASTFQQLDFVVGVRFFVDGVDMKNEKGEVIGLITKNDVVTDPAKKAGEKKQVDISLYFADEAATQLVKEKRKITISSESKIEKVVMEELIKGPSNKSKMISPIPSGTAIKDIEVKDGICYVDFNKEFKANHIGGSNAEMLTLYSIVNTLTELKGIEKVQFLIDGKKQSIYKGDYEFDKPFERLQ